MTIIIDGTVGANKAVVLDSNGKLPAIDGSLVTTLNATQVTTGSIATARLDTGTTNGKVLVLDGSGNMPAIAAASMTGIASATKSASDPTLSTNPATGLGTKWINTTSGAIFILTDATAGSNVWTNTGGTSGDIAPYSYGGELSGYAMGGGADSGPTQNARIDKYSFASDGDGVASGSTLSVSRVYMGAVQVQSSTDGYTHGGYSGGYKSLLNKFSFASAGTATTPGQLTTVGAASNGCNSKTHGYRTGGNSSAGATIDRWPFATDTNATDVGDLLTTMANHSSSTEGDTYGYVANAGVISKFAFASSANAVATTQTMTNRQSLGGNSSSTHGYTTGGWNGSAAVNEIHKYAFSSSVNASDIANLIGARTAVTSSTSVTHGYTASGGASDLQIEKHTFASDSDSTNVGNLPYVHSTGGGCHN